MKRRRVIQMVLLLAAAWLAWKCWGLVHDDPILSLIFFIFTGAAVGFWFVKVVLPWIADSIGTSIYMSGEKLTPGEEMLSDEVKALQEDKTAKVPEDSAARKDAPAE
jgi:hypothetical protein